MVLLVTCEAERGNMSILIMQTLPVGMSCVSPAMLIDEQSGEHGVALGSELPLLSFHCCPV